MGCEDCWDGFILHTCCSGRDCGCMGQPVAIENCKKCNPDDLPPESNDKQLLFYLEHLESHESMFE